MSVNTTLLAVVVNQNTKADNQYYPADVPTDYSWYGGANDGLVGPVSPPSGWDAVQQWGLVEQQAGAPASANVGATITVADMNIWVLLNTGAWVEVQAQASNQIFGGNYSADFATNNSTPLTRTVNADGSVTFNGPPAGENDHFYHGPPGTFTPGSVVGVFEEMNIKDSPGADLVAQLGADWYSSPTASPGIAGILTTNWVLLTDQYQTIYGSTVNVATLTSDPPPPLQDSGSSPPPPPAPPPTVSAPPEYATVAQMFEVGVGHLPTWSTLQSMVSSGLTDAHMAEAIVASQTFALVNNGGTLVNPNAPSSAAVVDSFFQQTLGHLPSAATLAGFSGLTNEQAFYAFATSATVTNVLGSAITSFIDAHYVG